MLLILSTLERRTKYMENKSQKIFELLTRIPKGKVTTYKALAQKAGIKNPRLIGSIIHKNTDTKKYPCHRVIRSDRSIANGYAFGGKPAQIKLLKSEGIAFNKNSTKILPGYILSTIQ